MISFTIVEVDDGDERGLVGECDLEGISNKSGIVVNQGGKSRTDVVVVAGSDGETAGAFAVIAVAAIQMAVFSKT